MQRLIVKGKTVEEFATRALAIVACFERKLVFDSHSRRRNQLLPWVKIEGKDEENYIGDALPNHPLD